MGITIETFQPAQPVTDRPEALAWAQAPAVQDLLDVLVLILAEEYVRTIKQHPDAFSRNGGTA